MNHGYDIEKLERHMHAPELNAAHLADGRVIKVPGCTSLLQAALMLDSKKVPIEKPLPLIELVEKAMKDAEYNTGSITEISSGLIKIFSVELLDCQGEINDHVCVSVFPDREFCSVMRMEKMLPI